MTRYDLILLAPTGLLLALFMLYVLRASPDHALVGVRLAAVTAMEHLPPMPTAPVCCCECACGL